ADQREPQCRVAGDKGAIARALVGRKRRRGELRGAAERLDLRRPGAAPMVLQHSIDEEAGTERRRQRDEDERARVEPPNLAAAGERDRTGDDDRADPPRDQRYALLD